MRLEDSRGDAGIRAAAADVAAHSLADALGVAAGVALGEQPDGAHDLAGRAVAALKPVVIEEGRLHRMEVVASGEALDGQHLGAVEARGEREAGIDPAPVDEDGAGAALAAVAALLGACEVQSLAQEVEQRDARVVESRRLAARR